MSRQACITLWNLTKLSPFEIYGHLCCLVFYLLSKLLYCVNKREGLLAAWICTLTWSLLKGTLFCVTFIFHYIYMEIFLHLKTYRVPFFSTFTWSVPWLTTLAVIVLGLGIVILYHIPVRWLVLAWGKF